MATVMGLAVVEGELRQIPKHGLNQAEVAHAFGSRKLVLELKRIGALVPVKPGTKTVLYDAAHVAEVWAKYARGDFDELLERR